MVPPAHLRNAHPYYLSDATVLLFSFANLYPPPQHVGTGHAAWRPSERLLGSHRTGAMQVPGYELPRNPQAVEKVGVELIATRNEA